nr:hypothetical protein [Nocardioides convexus]
MTAGWSASSSTRPGTCRTWRPCGPRSTRPAWSRSSSPRTAGRSAGWTSSAPSPPCARSSLDVVLLAGSPPPAPDALPARDAKAGAADSPALDPRVVLLLEEAYRHAKVVGAWGAGVDAVTATGLTDDVPGVVTGSEGPAVLAQVQDLMGTHRAWERFPASV